MFIVAINQTAANTPPKFLILNPGPESWAGAWTAGPPRYKGTSDFIFYSNETIVGNTFFLNVTVVDAERMKGWGIGLIFDHTKLSYAGSRRPPDHVFKPVQDMGWTIIAPSVTVEPINDTHSIIKWGCTYIIPEGETPWSFNGTGTLCQIQFKIIKETSADFCFTFDSNWTALYIFNPDLLILEPVPIEKLILESAYFKYFGIEPRESSDLLDLLLKIGAVVFILMVILISVFMMSRRSKHIKIKRRTTNFNLI